MAHYGFSMTQSFETPHRTGNVQNIWNINDSDNEFATPLDKFDSLVQLKHGRNLWNSMHNNLIPKLLEHC